MTHLIYRYEPRDGTDARLWEGLMEATHEIALECQRLEQALPSPLTPYSWLLIWAMAAFAAALLLLNRDQPSLSAFGAALSLGSLCLGMDLLVQTSRLSKREVAEFQNRYLANIEKSRD
ncbi:hypothetical protein HY734_03080 [Candidatus Uhrbacteria bacterium]|nr:hypothetical protein [Candidatus Uhrbacteria bacterium]